MNNARILATVGGKAISEADVEAFIASLGQRGAQYNTPEGRAVILEQLINDRLFLLDASRNMMEVDPAFKAQLARAKEALLVSFNVEKTLAAVKVTDAEAEAFYKDNPVQFEGREEVSASHILVADEETAAALLADIKEGKISFEDAAKNHSTCPSGQNGGALGRFGRGQMVPEFENACFAMQVGEIGGPVGTQFGYHIIRLDERHPATPIALKDCKEDIKSMLLQDKQKKAYQSKINQLKIMYPVDKF